MSVPKPFSGQRPFQSPEIKSVPSVTQPVPAEIGGRCRKAMLGVWTSFSVQLLRWNCGNVYSHNVSWIYCCDSSSCTSTTYMYYKNNDNQSRLSWNPIEFSDFMHSLIKDLMRYNYVTAKTFSVTSWVPRSRSWRSIITWLWKLFEGFRESTIVIVTHGNTKDTAWSNHPHLITNCAIVFPHRTTVAV